METKVPEILTFITITSILILLLVSFIIIIFYLYRKKQILFQKNLENIKLQYDKALLSTQVEIQEQTFQNISREIHDNIGLSLTLAKLQLNTVDKDVPIDIIDKVEISIEQITKAITDLTLLSKTLNSEYIEENGLITALAMELARIERSNLFKCSLKISGSTSYIESKKEVVIFRIIQEALNNAIKHSGATLINVLLDYSETCLCIVIEDNGKGFVDAKQYTQKISGSGLKNIRHRAKVINGTCEIEDNNPHGVSIKISTPLNDYDARHVS